MSGSRNVTDVRAGESRPGEDRTNALHCRPVWKRIPTPVLPPKPSDPDVSRLKASSLRAPPQASRNSLVAPSHEPFLRPVSSSSERPSKRQRINADNEPSPASTQFMTSPSFTDLPRSRARPAVFLDVATVNISSDEEDVVRPPVQRRKARARASAATTDTPPTSMPTRLRLPRRSGPASSATPTASSSDLATSPVRRATAFGHIPAPVAESSQATGHSLPVSASNATSDTNIEPAVSIASVKALLDLRKSYLEVLSEEQLPDELRAENIKILAGRAAAGVVAAGST
ncbi:hypothetical protein PENSPDRAFT_755697 [Peniophora sp. CONT]|nr:hypothetical protein PENSPDRAFT_755697 [Peniophora sp. CONT]